MRSRLGMWMAGLALAGAGLARGAGEADYLEQANRSAEQLRQHLLVVYNKKADDSERLAKFYALKRGIPPERVLGLSTSREEEIDRDTFNTTIYEPLNQFLVEKGFIERSVQMKNVQGRRIPVQAATRNDVWAIVLMRGMPLKIKNDKSKNDVINQPSASSANNASVDSELALLPTLGLPISGMLPNPYYFTGYPRPFDAVDARKLILVTRLDAPTSMDVERMIEDSLHAEKVRLSGVGVFDIRGLPKKSPYFMGDEWIRAALELMLKEGWPVLVDRTKHLFHKTTPVSDIALYAGWYHGKPEGPMFEPPNRFRRGAIAYHLHSFSASTLRKPKVAWTGPLLAHGAAASLGTVYEPYLAYTPDIGVFVDRLVKHFTFAEAAYMSQKSLSWMTVMVGDPLYRPFAKPFDVALAESKSEPGLETAWLEIMEVYRDLRDPKKKVTPQELKTRLLGAGAAPVKWEYYAKMLMALDRKKNFGEIMKALDIASNTVYQRIDFFRLQRAKVDLLMSQNRKGEARQLEASLVAQYPEEAEQFGFRAPAPPATKDGTTDMQGIPPSPHPRAVPMGD